MASQILGPRKQQTRQHVIADLSVNHVERLILEGGHTAQRLGNDYGYDLVMFTHDQHGYREPGMVFFQLKAAEQLSTVDAHQVFDLDVRDYNLWLLGRSPVILILFDATRKRAWWLHVQDYFRGGSASQPRVGAKTVRLHVPTGQVINRRTIKMLRERNRSTQLRIRGAST